MRRIDKLIKVVNDLKTKDYLPTFIDVFSNNECCYSETRIFDEHEKLIPTFKGKNYEEVFNQIEDFMNKDDYFKLRVERLKKWGCTYPYIVFDLTQT